MLITTDRLILREFEENDWRDILAYHSDPRYLRYYHRDDDPAEEDARAFVAMFLGWRREEPRYRFQLAITTREEPGRVIGNCGIRRKDPESRLADCGVELAPEFWGKGYATEAVREMLRLAFDDLGIHKVWTSSIAENSGAAHVVEKLGMRLEGRLRGHEEIRGRWHDVLLHGILAAEWRALDGEKPSMPG